MLAPPAIGAACPPQPMPAAAFDGLPARIEQATQDAAANGATISVAVLDRANHQLLSNGSDQIVAIASVAKLFIADDLLSQESDGCRSRLDAQADRQALDSHVAVLRRRRRRDLLGRAGRAIITQVAGRYGLTSTTPPGDGRWWNTISSAPDLVRYYEMLLGGSGGLPGERAGIIVGDLASRPHGNRRLPAAVRHP